MNAAVLIQQLFNALSLGSIYALLAIGLAVVYSILGKLNFAYGELVTTVGYTIYLLSAVGLDFWTGAVIGIFIATGISLVTEFIAFRPLKDAPGFHKKLYFAQTPRNQGSRMDQQLARTIWNTASNLDFIYRDRCLMRRLATHSYTQAHQIWPSYSGFG